MFSSVEFPVESLEAHADGGEGIPEFVGDLGRELPHGSHLPVLLDLPDHPTDSAQHGGEGAGERAGFVLPRGWKLWIEITTRNTAGRAGELHKGVRGSERGDQEYGGGQ